jgi:hypothetical protein
LKNNKTLKTKNIENKQNIAQTNIAQKRAEWSWIGQSTTTEKKDGTTKSYTCMCIM